MRVSNSVAINMYKKFGYSVYRQVLNYYSGEEDAYGARTARCRRARTRGAAAGALQAGR